ncbi:MAG: hypothetical protein HY367_02715 [Candidatus Aenigmarchaeota archaeon]|nr:hypothetical protein [Candidatus Aenigmarchaeota archaeon]
MVVLLMGAVIVSGCSRQGTTPDGTTGSLTGLKTCWDLNGKVCSTGQECTGNWVEASDTFACCSKACGGAEEPLTIETFDTTPENADLGEVS